MLPLRAVARRRCVYCSAPRGFIFAPRRRRCQLWDVRMDARHMLCAAVRARVDRDTNISLVVGSFPAAFEGGSTQAVELLGRGFDAVATAFFVDVMHDLPAALATLRSLLVPSRGLWLNLGPLVTGRPSNQGDPPSASAG